MAKATFHTPKPTVTLELTYQEACTIKAMVGQVNFSSASEEILGVTGSILGALEGLEVPYNTIPRGIDFDKTPWEDWPCP